MTIARLSVKGHVLRRLAPHAHDIVRQYEAGAEFHELGCAYGCSGGTIRRLLLSEEIPLRRAVRVKPPE